MGWIMRDQSSLSLRPRMIQVKEIKTLMSVVHGSCPLTHGNPKRFWPAKGPAHVMHIGQQSCIWETIKKQGQGNLCNHRLGYPGARAKMWSRTERNRGAHIARDVILITIFKMILVPIGRGKHEKHSILWLKREPSVCVRLCDAAR